MEKNKEIRELVDRLNAASHAYYQLDNEIMSNYEYDSLYDRLVALENETGFVMANSPTQKVGYTVVSELTKVPHDQPMLSLDKTKDIDELIKFLGNQIGILSWKLDGLSIVLKYQNGELTRAVTRGNGTIGEDVTHNAQKFVNIPMKIPYKGDLSVRGEAVIAYSDFDSELYKNPRNLTSGTIRQLNNETTEARRVRFYAFSVYDNGVNLYEKKSEYLSFVQSLGFETAGYDIVDSDIVALTVERYKNEISKMDLASDGLVLTYDDIVYSEALGATSKFPRDSMAFKWVDDIVETTLLDIEWSVSRTGLINPIAIFEAVEIESTTVSRASLHNVSIVESLGLGIGDTITVYKANMIIPQVEGNLTRSGTAKPPTECPVCNMEATIQDENDVKMLYCTNLLCSARIIGALSHFVSRNAMNITGLSEATIEKFVNSGFLKDYTDIYTLVRYEFEIVNMEGFGEKSYTKLITAIENSKRVALHNFIYALGINHVGLSNAKLICKYYGDDPVSIAYSTMDELVTIEGLGEVIADSVVNYFNDDTNRMLYDKMLGLLSFEKQNKSDEANILDGKIFVITGDLHSYKNRAELISVIERFGGRVSGSVSAKTNYLINNDSESVSGKNKKARELGVAIITENQFNEMI
jgi:DNA ligase (NAD+)